MLFDAHTHIFPDKLRGKVLPKLSQIANSPYYRGESREEALKENLDSGVTHALALHIATNPMQEKAVNDFAIASQSENYLCFGSVHPQSENRIEEIHRLHEAGIKGIKLHPDYQEFFSDDVNMNPVYELCQKLGLMITFHAGLDPYSPVIVHNTPKMMRKVATSFKDLTIIAAHMGGMNMCEEVENELIGIPNLYFDTAMASSFLDEIQFERIVRNHGINKILFATDSPWSRAEFEKKLIEKTNFTIQEKEKIYYKNAFELFNIKEF